MTRAPIVHRPGGHQWVDPKADRVPASVTVRSTKNYASRHKSRAPGDSNVARQTVLLTSLNPSQGNSSQPATSQDEHPFYSLDEKFVYFDSDRVSATTATPSNPQLFQIYRMNADGSGVTQITTGGGNKIEPAVDVSGQRVAYVGGGSVAFNNAGRDEVVTSGFSLFIFNQNTGTTINYTQANSSNIQFADVRHPSFAPGGNLIAFAGERTGESVYHLYTLNFQTGSIVQLTSGPASDFAPAWSPEGSVIAFTSTASGFDGITNVAGAVTPNIWVISPNPNLPNARRITFPTTAGGGRFEAVNKNPAWSGLRPDPRGLIPTNTNNGTSQLLLGFASNRLVDASNVTSGLANHFDIFLLSVTIARDTTVGGALTVTTPESAGNLAIHLRTSQPEQYINLDAQGNSNGQLPDTSYNFDPGNAVSDENYPALPQFNTTYRVVFQSNKSLNGDTSLNIFASTIIDINAPTLLRYSSSTSDILGTFDNSNGNPTNNPTIPSTHFFQPGTTVRFKVRAADYESGISRVPGRSSGVFLQIKDPNSAPKSADGVEHKTYTDGPGQLDVNNLVLDAPYEVESQAVNANKQGGQGEFRGNTGADTAPTYRAFRLNVAASPDWNPYMAGVDDNDALSGSEHRADWDDGSGLPDGSGLRGFWLPLYDDGDATVGGHEPPGEKAGDGVFTNVWLPPTQLPSDWLIDVIVYDEARDPFNNAAGVPPAHNWKIYDNVGGFTTQQFIPSQLSSILYVNDYDSGQRFFSSPTGTHTQGDEFGYDGLLNTRFNGWPTESWMTEMDPALLPKLTLNTTNGQTQILYNVLTPLGVNSYRDIYSVFLGVLPTNNINTATGAELTDDGTGIPATGRYDIWRIQCRGPIDDATLSTYGAHLVTQPADPTGLTTGPTQVTVAERCVIWHAPYTGDLFVGPGTLLDPDTQFRLTTFVANGGRLFVDGQDIGFGLTQNTPNANASAFLRDVLHVDFSQDFYVGGPPAIVNVTMKNGPGVQPISSETWYRIGNIPQHSYPPITVGPVNTPPGSAVLWIGPNPPGHPEDFNCPNQVEYDGMHFLAATTADVSDFDATWAAGAANANNAAIWWFTTAATGKPTSKVVGATLGIEGVNPEFFTGQGNPTPFILENRRAELIHNVSDYLRTGRIVGTVRDRDNKVVGGGFVRAVEFRNNRIAATAITQNDGSYVLQGLDANGIYVVDFLRAGYAPQRISVSPQHRQGIEFHGGYQAQLDITASVAQPGYIRGTVTVNSTGAPVAGAVVEAIDETLTADPITGATIDPLATSRQRYTGISQADGTYSIQVPGGGVYALHIINLDPTGSGAPGTLPYGGSIPPDYGLTITTTTDPLGRIVVNPGQTVTGKDFKLLPIPGKITGTVTQGGQTTNPNAADYNPNAGKPIQGATVTATYGQTTKTATTDANGFYTITNVDPGTVQVVASAVGFQASNPVTVTVQSNQTTANVNFVLLPVPPGTITGEVKTSGATGPQTGVGGATVSVVDANGNVLNDTKFNKPLTTTTGLVTGQDAGYFIFNNVPAGGTVVVQASKSGYLTPVNDPNPNQPVAKTTATIVSGQTTSVVLYLDPLQTFANLLSLVSAPYEYTTDVVTLLLGSNPAAGAVSGFNFITWNAATQSYVTHPTPPADTFHLGRGYFIQETNVNASLTLDTAGTPAPTVAGSANYAPFSISLSNGWNLIGDPFVFPVTYSQLKVLANGVTYSVPEAQTRGIIGAALWTYIGGSYELAFSLDPYHGYWVRALQSGVTLVVDPAARLGKSVERKGSRLVTTYYAPTVKTGLEQVGVTEGWKLKLVAEADGSSAPGVIGMHPQATNSFDAYKLAQAPMADPNHNVTLAFEHKDWGRAAGNYGVDVRSQASSSQTWDFTVASNVAGKPLNLRWPGMASVPRKVTLMLTDLTTGQKYDLRTRSVVTVPSGQGGTERKFRLEASRTERPSLILSNVTTRLVNPSGRSVSDGTVAIGYHITSDATVRVTIQAQGGRVIAEPEASRSRAAGDAEVTWKLRDNRGNQLPSGLYNIVIEATDTEGHQVRSVQPLNVPRF